MSIKINKWIGRQGNWLVQISNALSMAKKYETTLSLPAKQLIKKINISYGKSNYSASGSFFDVFSSSTTYPWPNWLEDDKEYAIENRWLLMKENDVLTHKELDINYDLVLHFRGGDIWTHGAHKTYIQCPLAYYDYVIECQNPNNILLTAEDEKNPIRKMVYEKYKDEINITERVGGKLENKVDTIINSRTIACGGFGTFIPSIIGCSNTTKKMYIPCFDNADHFHHTFDYCKSSHTNMVKNLYVVHIPNYIKKWSYSADSIEKIKTYDISNISLTKISSQSDKL